MQPLAIDLYCGLGGWTEGLLAEGYRVVGFDNERHEYGEAKYPAQLIVQDVLTLHGSQFKDAALIVASPPCQEYSYMAMPWSRAKAIAADYRSGARDMKKLTALFDACFRIQREASEAAGRTIPLVVENVRGAQPWVGRAAWNFGSFYLWGDVPALMPITVKRTRENGAKTPAGNCSEVMWKDRPIARLAHATPEEMERHGFKIPGLSEGYKSTGLNWPDRTKRGQDFTRVAGEQARRHNEEGIKAGDRNKARANGGHQWTTNFNETMGVKQSGISGVRANGKGDRWFQDGAAKSEIKSKARKAASAAIAKIPFVLAQHIARVYKPDFA